MNDDAAHLLLLEAASHYERYILEPLKCAGSQHITLRTANSISAARDILFSDTLDILLTSFALLDSLKSADFPSIPVIVLCTDDEVDQALAITGAGICDVVSLSQMNRLAFIIRRELEQKKSRERFHSIVEDQTDLVCRYDASGRLTFVNRAYQATYGRDNQSLIGKCLFDMIPAEEQTSTRAYLQRLTYANPAAITEHQSIMPDGSQRWFQWTDRALFDQAGRLIEYQGVGRDITDRIRLEAEQKAHANAREAMQQFLASTLDAFPANTAVLDIDGTIINVNAAWRRFANDNGGAHPDAFNGVNYLSVCETAAEDDPELPAGATIAAHIRDVIAGRQDEFSIEYPCHSPQEIRWFTMQVTPFLDPAPRRVVVAHINITARKLAEQELQALHNATSYLFKADSLPNLAHQIVQAVVREFEYVDCSVLLVSPGQRDIRRFARAGVYTMYSEAPLKADGKGLIPLAIRSGQIVNVGDVTQSADYLSGEPRTRSELVIPLVTLSGVIGALDLQRTEVNAFSVRDQRVLTAYAERAAAAIENMQLYEAVSQHASELKEHVIKRTAELQAAKERVEGILNHSLDAILFTHNDLRIRQANPAFNRMIGAEPDEYLNHSLLQIIHPDDIPEVKRLCDTELAESVDYHVEVRVFRKNGAPFDAELSIGAVKDNGLVCTIRDITRRKQAERDLRYQASLQEHVSDAVIVVDKNYKIRSWNRAAENIYGWSAAEAIGQEVDQFLKTQQEYPNFRADVIKEIMERGQLIREFTHHHRSGAEIYVLSSTSLLRDERGRPNGAISVNHDISERKKTDQALRDALAKERELSELKTRFVSMASHEFRTPLATILALTETLIAYRRQFPDEQIERRLHMIQEQIGYLRGIMEDVLLLARMQARRVDFNPEYLDLDVLCRSVIDEFQNRPEVRHQFVYQKDDDLPLTYLDSKLMRQILSNLISNAVKYSPLQPIVVISLERKDDMLFLKVHDDGIGIPEPDIKHLFEPFHRGANVGTISGTGLGLVITKESVELHGGSITFESSAGTGTTFIVTLPIIANLGNNDDKNTCD